MPERYKLIVAVVEADFEPAIDAHGEQPESHYFKRLWFNGYFADIDSAVRRAQHILGISPTIEELKDTTGADGKKENPETTKPKHYVVSSEDAEYGLEHLHANNPEDAARQFIENSIYEEEILDYNTQIGVVLNDDIAYFTPTRSEGFDLTEH